VKHFTFSTQIDRAEYDMFTYDTIIPNEVCSGSRDLFKFGN